jgi:hypothetical protein
VALGNAIFVRNRNSLIKNEQSMRSSAIQTGADEPRWGRPAIGLIESLKIQGTTYCFAFFGVAQLEIKLPLRNEG